MDAEPLAVEAPIISVLVCTLNGGEGLRRCLASVRRQSVGDQLQLIVVDDGSTDDSAEIARAFGAEVISHRTNRGLAAARNTGIAAARAPILATLDDDCEADPNWAERLVSGFDENTIAVGGRVVPAECRGYFGGYLERNNPLDPLEADLATSTGVVFRFLRYLLRNLRDAPKGERTVYAVPTANAAFRVAALRELGGFDECFRSDEGGEDLDLCLRIRDEIGGSLRFGPSAIVHHHFDTNAFALLRRYRSYGIGGARLYRKRATMAPTVYPYPVLLAGLLVWSRRRAIRAALALVLPQFLFSKGCRNAIRQRSVSPLADCYVKLAEETVLDIGFAIGLWRLRRTPK